MDISHLLKQSTPIPEEHKQLDEAQKFMVNFLNFANEFVLESTRGEKVLSLPKPYDTIYPDIMKHTNGMKSSSYNLNYGIAMAGKSGTGKTLLLKTILKTYHAYGLGGKLQTGYEIAQMYETEKQKFYELLNNKTANIFIDEIGDEPSKSSIYGNEESVGYRFLKTKLDQIESGAKFKLFFTTNLNGRELEERYGSRTMSRLRAYCNLILFDDEKFVDLR